MRQTGDNGGLGGACLVFAARNPLDNPPPVSLCRLYDLHGGLAIPKEKEQSKGVEVWASIDFFIHCYDDLFLLSGQTLNEKHLQISISLSCFVTWSDDFIGCLGRPKASCHPIIHAQGFTE